MKIFNRLFGRNAEQETAARLYDAVVEQSRLPVFYTACAVPDTVDGRFDLIILNAFLVFHRLRDEPEMKGLSQAMFDLMFQDMDRSLREMGVGDLGVPKRMKHMLKSFYGRTASYDEALARNDDDESLVMALQRNVYRSDEKIDPQAVRILAAYVRSSEAVMRAEDSASFREGRIRFAPVMTEGGQHEAPPRSARSA